MQTMMKRMKKMGMGKMMGMMQGLMGEKDQSILAEQMQQGGNALGANPFAGTTNPLLNNPMFKINTKKEK